MKHKMQMTTVIVLLFVFLATIGVGYALWSKTLKVEGAVNTGYVDSVFVDPFTDDDNNMDDASLDDGDTNDCDISVFPNGGSCDPIASGHNVLRKDKDVGICTVVFDPTDSTGETLLITIGNAYPSYYCTVFFDVQNSGSIPVKVLGLSLGGPAIDLGYVTGHWTDISIGQQIDPDEVIPGDLDLHVEQIAPQEETFTLVGKIQLVQWNEFALPWETCDPSVDPKPPCNEAPDVSFAGNTVTMGQVEGEASHQRTSVHGGAVILTPALVYDVTFDYDICTWDAYVPYGGAGTGYWDSFSVSISDKPYWEMGYTDPVGLPFVRGGAKFGDGVLDCWAGTETLSIPGNMAGDNYLNVVLDTGTLDFANSAYPSYGTITIKSIVMDP
jgi:hypothetical protein